VLLCRESSANAVKTGSGTGKQVSLHSTAAGTATLAHLPDETVAGILNRCGLPATTPATITDEDELREELPDLLLGTANELRLSIAYS